jgi:hypothetical protein
MDKKRTTNVFDSKDASLFLLVGKSARGKSYFIRYLLYDRFKHPNWRGGIAFVGTKYTGAYDYLPDKAVIQGYDEKVLKAYVDNLTKQRMKGSLQPSFIMFDDLVGVLTTRSQWFTNFITTFRHLNINIIISVQYIAHGVSTTVREQTNFAILFRSDHSRTLKYFYNEFGSLLGTYQDFKDSFNEMTEKDYHAMLFIDKETDSAKNFLCIAAPANLSNYILKY